jgi:hypothetical protein
MAAPFPADRSPKIAEAPGELTVLSRASVSKCRGYTKDIKRRADRNRASSGRHLSPYA